MYGLLSGGDDLSLELLIAALKLGLELFDALCEATLNVGLGGLELLILEVRLKRGKGKRGEGCRRVSKPPLRFVLLYHAAKALHYLSETDLRPLTLALVACGSNLALDAVWDITTGKRSQSRGQGPPLS